MGKIMKEGKQYGVGGKPNLGSTETISLPYTASQSGFLFIYINPSSASGGYASVSVGGYNSAVSTANGNGNSLWIPIAKGETASVSSSNGVSITARFKPFK